MWPPGGWGWGGKSGGGGALTLVLGTHCKTDSRSCSCRLEKVGLSRTQQLSGGGCQGTFPVGAVVVSLASPRNDYSYKSNCSRTTENDVHWGQAAVTTVITIGLPLIP